MTNLTEAQRRRWIAEQLEREQNVYAPRDADNLHGFDPAEDEFRDPADDFRGGNALSAVFAVLVGAAVGFILGALIW